MLKNRSTNDIILHCQKDGQLSKGYAPEVAIFEHLRVGLATVSLLYGRFHRIAAVDEIKILCVSSLLNNVWLQT